MEQQADSRWKVRQHNHILRVEKNGMDKMCQLTGNTKSVKNGFSSLNSTINWGTEVKDIIKTAVAAAIEHKDNDHALVLTEMRTANKLDLQKTL